MAKKLNTRAAAAKLSWQIIDNGQSLDAVIASYNEVAEHSPQDRGFIQELVYGVCRWYGELDAVALQLLRSPIRKKDRVVHFVLLVGLYQLRHIDTADHAAVAGDLPEPKQPDDKSTLTTQQLSHPQWIRQTVEKAWPSQANDIINANNLRPPMCLRVNRRQFTRDDYLKELSF